jgi:hypothetical protein
LPVVSRKREIGEGDFSSSPDNTEREKVSLRARRIPPTARSLLLERSRPMSRRILSHGFVAAVAAAALLALAPQPASAQQIHVTITNLTSGQVITPIAAASTQSGVTIFHLGQPASVALEKVAEAGDTSDLRASLMANAKVLDVQAAGAPLPPGQSVTLTLKANPNFDHLVLAAMLVPTNDGFIALNGVDLGPLFRAPSTGPQMTRMVFDSPGYDAGTELDDELCSNVPGPPDVCTGQGFNASRAGAPNFVFIHAGIRGIGDVPASAHDWKNPVAKIVVELVR